MFCRKGYSKHFPSDLSSPGSVRKTWPGWIVTILHTCGGCWALLVCHLSFRLPWGSCSCPGGLCSTSSQGHLVQTWAVHSLGSSLFWSREASSLIRSWIRLGSSWAHNVPVLAHEWGLARVNNDLFAILGAVSKHVCVQAEVGCYMLNASTCLHPLLRRQRGEKNKLIFPS